MKKCTRCFEEKDLSGFYKEKRTAIGYQSICISCFSERHKQKTIKNNLENPKLPREKKPKKAVVKTKKQKEQIRLYCAERRKSPEYREKQKLYKVEWHKKNKERLNKKAKEYAILNKEHIKLYKKSYKNRRSIIRNDRWRNDIIFNITSKVRVRTRKAIKEKGWKKSSKTADMLGCSFEILKKHLERNFTKGMTWEKLLIGEIHIDHKIPLSTAKTEDDVVILSHYTNLQPLWAYDNLVKNSKVLPTQMIITI